MVIKSCYIYTRVSTLTQVEGYSLDAQLGANRKYAQYRGLRIAGEYCDAGKSGKNIKGRPEFRKMMEDIISQKDKISFVLVFKLSRFGRNAADIMRSLQTLADFGVDLVSVNESIDSSTQGGRLTLAILSAVAEMERENIRVQFMSGKAQKVMNGGWGGGPVPYGYRSVDHELVPDPYEAEVIRTIFSLYLQEGNTIGSVADALNKSSNRSRNTLCGNEKPFDCGFVGRILSNPIYCGEVCYYRRTNKKDRNGKTIKLDPESVVNVKGNHELIVSKEIWNKAYEKRLLIAQENKKPSDPVYVHILAGLIRCPVCGRLLSGSVIAKKKLLLSRDGYYKAQHYYLCRYRAKRNGRRCSFKRRLNQEIVDELVFQVIANLKFTREFEDAVISVSGSGDEVEFLEGKLKKLRMDLRDAENRKNKLGENLDALDPDGHDYDKSYERISNGSFDNLQLSQESIASRVLCYKHS